jgi:nucleoside-triphosphatase THEP1
VKVVLAGPIGSGKSTAVRAAMHQLGWRQPAGFFTHWDARPRGADILYFETWSGEQQLMARRRAVAAAPGEPPYELDPANFTRRAVASLADAAAGRPVVIDELGLVELGAAEFTAAVAKLFRGPAPVLAVIQQRALERWLELIGRENAGHLLRVDPATRAALPARIAALFRA